VGEDSPSCAPSPGGPGSYEPDSVGLHSVGEQCETPSPGAASIPQGYDGLPDLPSSAICSRLKSFAPSRPEHSAQLVKLLAK
jgi:hypothetical protein